MKLLLDTQLLLWAAEGFERLPPMAQELLSAPENELYFSAASFSEIGVKRSLGRGDFQVDARVLRRNLLDNGYHELAMTSEHVLASSRLPHIRKDPFDRILVGQATVEGITLLTVDPQVADYPGPVRLV